MTDADKRMNPVLFGSDPADSRIGSIRKSGFECPGHFWSLEEIKVQAVRSAWRWRYCAMSE